MSRRRWFAIREFTFTAAILIFRRLFVDVPIAIRDKKYLLRIQWRHDELYLGLTCSIIAAMSFFKLLIQGGGMLDVSSLVWRCTFCVLFGCSKIGGGLCCCFSLRGLWCTALAYDICGIVAAWIFPIFSGWPNCLLLLVHVLVSSYIYRRHSLCRTLDVLFHHSLRILMLSCRWFPWSNSYSAHGLANT